MFSLMPVLGLYWLDSLAVAGGPPRASGLLPAGGFALAALMAGAAIEEYGKVRVRQEPYLRLRRAVSGASAPAVVFVRRPAGHSHHVQLVVNEPNLAGAAVWLVHDLGERNRELLQVAGERAAYVFDEASGRLVRMGSAGGG